MTEAISAASRTIDVKIVNAFIRFGSRGNPPGVVLDADQLDEREMQAITARTGLLETAFVSRSESHPLKLDFFTSTRRFAHRGHATIRMFSVLAAFGRVGEGLRTSKETVDGPQAIEVVGGAAFMEQLAPRYSTPADWAASSVDTADILGCLHDHAVAQPPRRPDDLG